MTYRILPSILSADFARLGAEAQASVDAGADGIHFDVMDNHYVPNLTLGAMGCTALRKNGFTAPIDVHLMTNPVDSLIQAFAKAGASCITIHADATKNLNQSLALIKSQGCDVGLAINPDESIDTLKTILNKLNQVLVMSVYPGFGGQTFISTSLEKIKAIKALRTKLSIAVDGGINVNNIHAVSQAGADTFVVGSAFFNTDNYFDTIKQLRGNLYEE